MVIYDQEKEDGISIEMLCKGSISYATCIEPTNAESIGNKKTSWKADVPGRMITMTPKSPNMVAVHRRGPTFSPKNTTEKIVIITGLTKKMATASASGMVASPIKKKVFAKTTQAPRKKCIPKRDVFNTRDPPLKGIIIPKKMIMPISDLAITTSCKG